MALFWFSGNSNSASASTSVFGFLALSRRNVTGSERFGVAARGGVSMASISGRRRLDAVADLAQLAAELELRRRRHVGRLVR